jgi:hypothetical protein
MAERLKIIGIVCTAFGFWQDVINIGGHPSAFGANVIVPGKDDFPQPLPSCSVTALC